MNLLNKYSINPKALLIVLLVSLCFNIYQGFEVRKSEELAITLENTINELEDDLLKTTEKEDITNNPVINYIHIVGEIENSGVYKFSSPVKVFEVVDKAGGLTEKADVKNINLVKTVYDGDKIYIPNQKDVKESNQEVIESNYININIASEEELMTLNGIGEAKAKAIIEYREEVKRFSSKEDILEVSGIGPAIYDKIVSSIRVN
ncbi:MAG: helix-hairpin-helix domain-containing protein [Clostridia bacterium]